MGEKTLTANMEDYLEAIGTLARSAGVTRVKEISEALNVTTPSVHSALHLLVDKGLIEHEHYGYIRLTDAGARMAEEIIRRHELLEGFLRDLLGLPAEEAGENACGMEHVMSDDALNRLERFIEFLKDRPEWESWVEEFHRAMDTESHPADP